MQLTQRDEQVLHAIYEYRYLTTEHVHTLLFGGMSNVVPQTRLRKLWRNHYVDRRYLPFVLDGTRACLVNVTRPLYCLARRGAAVVARNLGSSLTQVPHTPAQNAGGFATMQHNLVATDFLVAAAAASSGRGNGRLVCESEHVLRAKAMTWAQHRRLHEREYIVPDGSVTVRTPDGVATTFYLEVVRADVRGGNSTLAAKLRKYMTLLRGSYFRLAFGHERVRAVLLATTTPARAQNLRRLANDLVHGRNLFWFSAYERVPSQGIPATLFTPDTMLQPVWTDVSGVTHALLPSVPPAPSASSLS